MRAGQVELVSLAPAETFLVDGKELLSGIRKRPQDGPVRVLPQGLEGDDVGDREHHGGLNRALHVFAAEAYDDFEAKCEQLVPRPWVGENLTLRGFADASAHVGDRIRAGTALLQVTMPTERCGNPGLVSGIPKLRKWMIDSLQTGFYLRVIEPGQVQRGDAVELVQRGDPKWTIAALSEVMYRLAGDAEVVEEVSALPALAPEWKERIRVLHERKRR